MKFGYEMRDYRSSTDYDMLDIHGSLEYQFSSLTKFIFAISRGTREADYRGEGLSENMNSSLQVMHQFASNRKFEIGSKVDYWEDNYTNGGSDKTFCGSGSLAYNFRRWLRLVFEYTYRAKNSSKPLRNYDNNIISLKTKSFF